MDKTNVTVVYTLTHSPLCVCMNSMAHCIRNLWIMMGFSERRRVITPCALDSCQPVRETDAGQV